MALTPRPRKPQNKHQKQNQNYTLNRPSPTYPPARACVCVSLYCEHLSPTLTGAGIGQVVKHVRKRLLEVLERFCVKYAETPTPTPSPFFLDCEV